MTRLALVLVVLAACAPDSRPSSTGDDDAPPPGPDAGTPDADVPGFIDASPPVPDGSTTAPEDGVVYGHSSSTLYKIDPETYAVTMVANFVWPANVISDSMTDLAIDKNGVMTGVSFTRAYRIDPQTAACTFLGNLDHQFNGLSYVPDPATGGERLVGTTLDGTVWRIDPATGATAQVGAYGNGWTSSGDIVYVEDFGIVATVKQNALGGDFLARIDPDTFVATPIQSADGAGTGYSDIFGLGFWKGKVFGFSGASQMLLIDPATGVGTLLSTGQNVTWWGAGVTTSAPVIP